MARNRRRLAVVAGCGLLVGAGALGLLLAPENHPASDASAATATTTASDPPKTIPPPPDSAPSESTATDPEVTAPGDPAPTQAGPRDVSVMLTYAGYMPESSGVVAGGFADAVIENDGTCTLTLTQGGTTRQASGRASADVAATSCGELKVPQAELSSGEWQATISYSSARSRGTSSPFPVEMP